MVAMTPTVGAFAVSTSSVTDTVQLTMAASCTFSAATNTYSATMAVNSVNNTVGTTSMNVKCNKYNGYYVTGTMTALTNSSATSNTIPYGASAPAAGTAKWAVYDSTSGVASYITSGGRVMQNTGKTSTSGDTHTLVYKVATGAWQPTGTYSGTATYTLTSPYVAA